MTPDETVQKWQRLFRLDRWTIHRFERGDRPSPNGTAAYCEVDFPTRTAKIWANSEAEVVHELGHVLTAGLDDAFWRTGAPKSLRALYSRREEDMVKRIERAVLAAIKEGARRTQA